MSVRIDNWFPTHDALAGTITGHPDPEVGVGKLSVTSPVVGKRGGKVITQSGTEYQLGAPLNGRREAVRMFLKYLNEV